VGAHPGWVQPRSGRHEITGEWPGALLVRVAAPAVEGKANEAVRKLLAKRLGVAPSRVAVVGGASVRDKLIDVEGMETGPLPRERGLTT
jgi:uncharacterized protein